VGPRRVSSLKLRLCTPSILPGLHGLLSTHGALFAAALLPDLVRSHVPPLRCRYGRLGLGDKTGSSKLRPTLVQSIQNEK